MKATESLGKDQPAFLKKVYKQQVNICGKKLKTFNDVKQMHTNLKQLAAFSGLQETYYEVRITIYT